MPHVGLAVIHTDEQRAILHHACTTSDSFIIDAKAGTGKTSTLIEILKVLPQASAIVLAFNKRIADEMSRRMPRLPRTRVVHVRTLHATGYWILRHHFPLVKISREITEQRIREASGKGASLRVLGASTKLLRLVKDFQHEPELDLDFAFHLGTDFGVFDKLESGHEIANAVDIVGKAYAASLEVGDEIDFPDQGWLPLVLNLEPPSRYRAVLLDEAQDVNANQMAMVERLLAPGGRIIAAGDLSQELYSWRGAVGSEIWDRLQEQHKASTFPLTITWRCDREIVREANRLVPELRARADAELGGVHTIDEDEFVGNDADGPLGAVTCFEGSTFVLSRTNAELLRIAFELWKRSVPFNMAQSPEIIQPLKGVLAKILKNLLAPSAVMFQQALAAWRLSEMMKAQAASSSSWADRIEEQYQMLLFCSNYTSPRGIEDLLDNIYCHDETCEITLSTVHKAKGLEADNVFLLRETFQRYQNRVDRDGKPILVPQEEDNIEYVAITRARHMLTWVCLKRES